MLNTKNRKRGMAGFTLVELMLVLVILGTLAAIVVPKLSGRTEKARMTAAQTDISNLELTLNMFEVEVGHYPETDDGLYALVEDLEDDESWDGPYLDKGVPLDPWDNEYIYEYPGRYNINGFDLYSMGPDDKEGTEDDIVNWMENRR